MATANVDKQTAEPCNSERNEDLIDDNERMVEAIVEESKDIPLEPLNTPWTFWIDRSVRGTTAKEYESSLTKIYTVDSVQGFWSVYHHIPEADKLSVRFSYHMMRNTRRPVWEDENNTDGGSWTFKCKKQDTLDIWKHLLLAAIGEQFSDSMADDDEVTGISVSIRDRDDLILIWNKRACRKDASTVVQTVRELVPHVAFNTVFYKAFTMHEAYEGKKQYHRQ